MPAGQRATPPAKFRLPRRMALEIRHSEVSASAPECQPPARALPPAVGSHGHRLARPRQCPGVPNPLLPADSSDNPSGSQPGRQVIRWRIQANPGRPTGHCLANSGPHTRPATAGAGCFKRLNHACCGVCPHTMPGAGRAGRPRPRLHGLTIKPGHTATVRVAAARRKTPRETAGGHAAVNSCRPLASAACTLRCVRRWGNGGHGSLQG